MVEWVLIEEAEALLLGIKLLHDEVEEVLGVALVPRGAHCTSHGLGLDVLDRRGWGHVLWRRGEQRALYVDTRSHQLVLEQHS